MRTSKQAAAQNRMAQEITFVTMIGRGRKDIRFPTFPPIGNHFAARTSWPENQVGNSTGSHLEPLSPRLHVSPQQNRDRATKRNEAGPHLAENGPGHVL